MIGPVHPPLIAVSFAAALVAFGCGGDKPTRANRKAKHGAEVCGSG